RFILAHEDPDEGTVDVNTDARVGYFSQFSELDGAASVQEVLEAVFADVRAIEQELEQVGADASVPDLAPARMEKLLDRQAELLEAMEQRDGWDYPRHIETALTKLGFNETRRHQPIETLSGGWRNRASLAQILLTQPDVLLLDEPTNFLDVEGVAWLEEWLRSFRGGLILVSHDRQFLDAVVTRIVEVENYHLHDYPGIYSEFIRAKPFRIKTLEKQFLHEEELLTLEAEAIADRQELAQNPTPGTLRKLADIKKRRPPRPMDQLITTMYGSLRTPENLLRVEQAGKRYGDQTLFSEVSFEVRRGDRVAIVGPNGVGKSTLLRTLTGDEKLDTGRILWESGVKFSDFSQVQRDLDPKDTVTHAVNVTGLAYAATRKEVGRFLTLLQFSETDQQAKIGTLSGGQRARVALAVCLLSGAGVLLLDEPTNHLDLASTQVMEQALAHFPGALVVVSHDRFFLDKVATRLLIFGGAGEVEAFEGNWTTWSSAKRL
ncbi:MAG: ABC-F family ATP-binding cassette domain-containing protein, partial [Cytophagales bacterium]|nr:ABC-F family ATP-binding cassette domain-containing protein [Armatimonadota bacterium]